MPQSFDGGFFIFDGVFFSALKAGRSRISVAFLCFGCCFCEESSVTVRQSFDGGFAVCGRGIFSALKAGRSRISVALLCLGSETEFGDKN